MAEDRVQPAQGIAFGPFRLLPGQQRLLENERPVPLGSRALDILLALVSQPGQLVGKAELMAQVWPSTFVDETNLRVHMTALRKALRDGQAGERYILTVPGRGYRFVAAVSVTDAPPPPPQPAAAEPSAALAPPLTYAIGRTGIIAAVAAQLRQARFVTLVGPGGIGKSTVAAAVASELAPFNRDGIGFIDLGPVSDPALVSRSLASVLGLAIPSEDPIQNVLAFLRRKQMLLVFDCCEHIIEAAAAVTEDIFKAAPEVQILATSREPLRAVGERVHRLAPLEYPSDPARLTAAEALEFSSIQLFAERAAAALDEFSLTDADAPVVADICRRLDGIPLAIELAAGRVAAFGIRELALRLDDRFRLLMSGRRTALPRHQTLAAMLEWSYQLLPETEQTLLRQLAVFAGEFTLAAAAAVATDLHAADVADRVSDLVTKSLVVADLRSDRTRYRLLDTTRLYCLEKLHGGDELARTAQRHAEYYRGFFVQAEADSDTLPRAEWLSVYAGQLGNLRSALEWSFSPAGSRATGVALTVAAVPLWVELSLMAECRAWVERALASIEGDPADAAARARMQLGAALGWARLYGAGPGRETGAAWAATLALAEQLGDAEYRSRALSGLWLDSLNNGALPQALDLARQFEAAVANSPDPIDRLMADRMLATSLHYIGDQETARDHMERMLRRYAPPGRRAQLVRFQRDLWITARYFQARIVWLQGLADQARRIAETTVAEAQTLGHALLLGSALGQAACPIALFSGDVDGAELHAAALLDHADRHALQFWHLWVRCFNGLLAARRGDIAAGVASMRGALAEADAAAIRSLPRYLPLLGEFAWHLGQIGEIAAGLKLIEESLARCDSSGNRWYLAELLRIKGELILAAGDSGSAATAEDRFQDALGCARRQGALAWELRAAVSLARLHRDQGRRDDARQHVTNVLGRFSEGFETADLRVAGQLAASLA